MRPVEELRFLILAAQREGNRMLAQALRPLGITPAQADEGGVEVGHRQPGGRKGEAEAQHTEKAQKQRHPKRG